jgi:thiol-disulfide isomerase/thioredoxin
MYLSDKSFEHEINSASLLSDTYALLHHQLNIFKQGAYVYKNIYKDVSQTDTSQLEKLNKRLQEFDDYKRQTITGFVKANNEKPFVALLVKDQIEFLDFKVVKEAFDALPTEIQQNTTGKFIADFIQKETIKKSVIVATPTKETTVVTKKKVEYRPAAYAFSGKTHEGTEMSLASISNGKVVLIDFWASWCQPCRVQSPHLVSLYKKYKSQGLEILSVSEDTNEAAWAKAIVDDHFNWNTHIIDNNKSIAFRYGIEAIPHTILIDKNGKIAAEKLSGNRLETKIKQLLNE